MMKILCNESSFDVSAVNGSYYGLGQMGRTQIADANVSHDPAYRWSAAGSSLRVRAAEPHPPEGSRRIITPRTRSRRTSPK